MASLIPFDCSEDEAALLIKRALDDLKGSTDEIFSRATNRMNEYQTRLDGYRRRFALVERKFEQIQKVSSYSRKQLMNEFLVR
jgi:hypothetical protein